MNEYDLAREMRKMRKERISRMTNNPQSVRRLSLIQKLEDTQILSDEEWDELRQLQKHFNLPSDFDRW